MRHKSVLFGSDSEALKILLSIHCATENPTIIDCTYNKGVMWKKTGIIPITMDIDYSYKTDYVADFRKMPFCDSSFDVIVFDPPHLPRTAATNNSSKIYEKRYGITDKISTGRSGYNINDLFDPFLREANRVLRKNGIILAKLIDIIHNHDFQWQHVSFINKAFEIGLKPYDLLIKINKSSGPDSSKWKNVQHLRRAHTYWIVVKKCKK
jgi:SAM-dependent methyltransferase